MIAIKNHYKPFQLFLTLFFIIGTVCADDARKENSETEWTLGAGLGVFNYKLYPGAKRSDQLVLPVPYFTYRSPMFEIDRGIKSFIYNSEEMVVDISADFGLPVDSDDTEARQGMPDLDFVLQLGPSLEFMLNDKKTNYFDVRFEIPARVAFVANLSNSKNIGYLIEPRLSFNHHRSSRNGLSHKATIGLKFATQEFNAYYYDVAAEFAIATRAEYKSNAGFAGGFINYRMAYNKNNFVYWAFVRYQSLRGAQFEDSPLVLQKDYYFFGAGISWIFARSL